MVSLIYDQTAENLLFKKVVADTSLVSELEKELEEEFSLPTSGNKKDLQARVQLAYLGIHAPEHEEEAASFFGMNKSALEQKCEEAGLEVKGTKAVLRRALCINLCGIDKNRELVTAPAPAAEQSFAATTFGPAVWVPATQNLQVSGQNQQASAPQTSIPQTSVQQMSAPQTSVPQTSVPQMSVPQASGLSAAAPPSSTALPAAPIAPAATLENPAGNAATMAAAGNPSSVLTPSVTAAPVTRGVLNRMVRFATPTISRSAPATKTTEVAEIGDVNRASEIAGATNVASAAPTVVEAADAVEVEGTVNQTAATRLQRSTVSPTVLALTDAISASESLQEVVFSLESTLWMARGPLMGRLRADDRRYLDALARKFHDKFLDRVMNASRNATN